MQTGISVASADATTHALHRRIRCNRSNRTDRRWPTHLAQFRKSLRVKELSRLKGGESGVNCGLGGQGKVGGSVNAGRLFRPIDWLTEKFSVLTSLRIYPEPV